MAKKPARRVVYDAFELMERAKRDPVELFEQAIAMCYQFSK
jgi:ribosomal protein S7